MEFGSEEEHVTKGKLPFSYSSSSSPSSSSSLHKPHLVSFAQNHQMSSSWLATKYEPENEDLNTTDTGAGAAAASKIEFMEIVNDDGGGEAAEVEKEHMFDKVVTPSDVGKLNRLVIPKQHAEKYFPLDSTTNEKGLLLNFEDRSGKAWRFRYSYWNSSQSYVMTKGWSRFVKDKKLDAGDIVSFQRGMGDSGKERLFIDWKRRPVLGGDHSSHSNLHHHHHRHFQQQQQQQQYHYLSSIPWSPLLMRPPGMGMGMMQNSYSNGGRSSSYGYNCSNSGTIVYMRSAAGPQMVQWQQGGGGGSSGVVEPMVYESVPVVQGKVAAKRLRLFGVNMDCPLPAESEQCDHQLSSSAHHPLQLKLYNGNLTPPPSQFLHKGKSSMSFDLDI